MAQASWFKDVAQELMGSNPREHGTRALVHFFHPQVFFRLRYRQLPQGLWRLADGLTGLEGFRAAVGCASVLAEGSAKVTSC